MKTIQRASAPFTKKRESMRTGGAYTQGATSIVIYSYMLQSPLLLDADDAFFATAELLVVRETLHVSKGTDSGRHEPGQAEHAAPRRQESQQTHIEIHAEPTFAFLAAQRRKGCAREGGGRGRIVIFFMSQLFIFQPLLLGRTEPRYHSRHFRWLIALSYVAKDGSKMTNIPPPTFIYLNPRLSRPISRG